MPLGCHCLWSLPGDRTREHMYVHAHDPPGSQLPLAWTPHPLPHRDSGLQGATRPPHLQRGSPSSAEQEPNQPIAPLGKAGIAPAPHTHTPNLQVPLPSQLWVLSAPCTGRPPLSRQDGRGGGGGGRGRRREQVGCGWRPTRPGSWRLSVCGGGRRPGDPQNPHPRAMAGTRLQACRVRGPHRPGPGSPAPPPRDPGRAPPQWFQGFGGRPGTPANL